MTVLEAETAESLDALIDDCETLGIRRRLLLVRLPPNIARPIQPAVRRVLMERLTPFTAADRVRLFRLRDEDLAVTWRDGGARDRMIDEATNELQLLLSSLAEAAEAAQPQHARPATPASSARLLLCDLPADSAVARRFLDETIALQNSPPAWQPAGQRLDLRELAGIEQALAQADVARFVRRQRIWEMVGTAAVLRWEHRRLDLNDLAASLAPGYDLAADPWLLRRLRRTLDRRMLALLSDPAETRAAQPFMIDLAVTSLLDPAFRRFNDALPFTLRTQVAVRIAPIDLVDDAASFGVARDAAKSRGHRVVLAASNPEVLSGFDLPLTGVDHVELSWRSLQGGALDIDFPAASVILTDIPDTRALAQARARGVVLFAGPGLERMV
jgi:hypothetical protein